MKTIKPKKKPINKSFRLTTKEQDKILREIEEKEKQDGTN